MKKSKILLLLAMTIGMVLSACSKGGESKDSNIYSDNSTVDESTEVIESEDDSEHVHDYVFDSFVWNEEPGNYTAQAKYICVLNEEHVQYFDAKMSKEESSHLDPGCETKGRDVWLAFYDDNVDTKEPTYTVSFSANGGTGTMTSIEGVSGEYALPACTFTAPEGKEFAGWKVNGTGNLLQAGDKITVTANVELVAQWRDSGDTPVTPDDPVTPDEPSKSSSGLSGGAIAGIVIGSVAVAGGIGVGVFFLLKKKGIILKK